MGNSNNKYRIGTKSNRKTFKLTKSIKGSVGEYQQIVNFLKEGFMVAKAVDVQCPFDLIIVDQDGVIELIDVKTATYRKKLKKPHYEKRIGRGRTLLQKKLNIKLRLVDYED